MLAVTGAFILFGMIFVVWRTLSNLVSKSMRGRRGVPPRWLYLAQWLLFVHVQCVMMWLMLRHFGP